MLFPSDDDSNAESIAQGSSKAVITVTTHRMRAASTKETNRLLMRLGVSNNFADCDRIAINDP